MSSNTDSLSISPQQKSLKEFSSKNPLKHYRTSVAGDVGVFSFLLFEFYQIFFTGLGGALGLFSRRVLLSYLFDYLGQGLVCNRWVTLRLPSRIRVGDNVLLDDGSVLDIRIQKNHSAKITLGDSVVVGRNSSVISKDGEIYLEGGVNISSNCRIATQSKIRIGRSTLIAAYCYIGPGNHQRSNSTTPLIEQEMEIKGGVEIGQEVWIGTHSTILDGVTIGDGAIIGAHSLVRDSVPPHTVVAGVPARVIGPA